MKEVDCVFEGLGFLTDDYIGMGPCVPRCHIHRVNPLELYKKVLSLNINEGFYYRHELNNLISGGIDIKKNDYIVFNERIWKEMLNREELIEFLNKNPNTFRYVQYVQYC